MALLTRGAQVSASIYALPATPPARHRSRAEVLSAVLDPKHLPTAPAVAVQVVTAARRPDCDPAEIVALLALDSALCAKLLRAVNSCVYGLKSPIASVARAVHVLGLNTVRSLALGLSIPAVQVGGAGDRSTRAYWLSSVGGAIIARELSVLTRRSNPDDDLVAGLLRDVGELLLRRAYPDEWAAHTAYHGDRLIEDPCGAETESFGVDHADISAELLAGWKLPDDLVEPIRHHHRPAQAAADGKVRQNRAELLYFSNMLVQLDVVAQNPDLLESVLATARDKFHLSRDGLIAFLQGVAPKVEAFAAILNKDLGSLRDAPTGFGSVTGESLKRSAEGSRPGGSRAGSTPTAMPAPAAPDIDYLDPGSDSSLRPQYRASFADQFPDGGCRLDRYELCELLGRGVNGVVFKAIDSVRNRFVAVKTLAPELAPSAGARERFAREARHAASVRHENTVGIHAVSESNGTPYLVMEWVRGGCLEARTAQHGAMPVLLVVSTARQIAAALAAGHAKGIVHGDVKPANVLLEDETGRVKLTDFGLVRVAEEGARAGSPFHMAPEVIAGQPATALSDVYSLGVLMFQMATGRLPFTGQSLDAVFEAARSVEPPPPSSLRGNMPDWLDEMILRLLQKDPAARYPDAGSVAAILGECC